MKDAFTVVLNKDTYDLLLQVKDDLDKRLGFVPTNGQVVRHLISLYFGEAELPST
jgi:hypothetical protein